MVGSGKLSNLFGENRQAVLAHCTEQYNLGDPRAVQSSLEQNQLLKFSLLQNK